MLRTPYLLFLGDAPDPLAAKVAQGIREWRPEIALGQYRMEGCNADLSIPDLSIADAVAAGAQTLVIGVANRGGKLSETWIETLIEALNSGLDIASGLHTHLHNYPELVAAAEKNGRALHDVRIPPTSYPIADGKRRSGKRLLTVGTDCAVGKMYATLAIEKEMKARGMKATFRATGQTGILISGDGVPLDAVVADFMAGSIEYLTPDNDEDHWDLIEGQGSLFHVSFSGVSLALLHGAQPDALILAHEPTRPHMRGLPGYPLPRLEAVRDLTLTMAQIINPDAYFAGIAVNTKSMSENEVEGYLAKIEDRMDLPTVDPVRQGAERLVDALK